MSAKFCFWYLLLFAFILEKSIGGTYFVFSFLLSWFSQRREGGIFKVTFFVGLLLDLFSQSSFGAHSLFFLLSFLFFSYLTQRMSLFFALLPTIFLFTGVYESYILFFQGGKIVPSFDFFQGLVGLVFGVFFFRLISFLKERIILQEPLQLQFGL